MLALNEPIAITREKDAATLTLLLRLDYESLRTLLVELLLEAFGVGRQDPSLRKEVKLVRQHSLHVAQVLREQILARNHVARW